MESGARGEGNVGSEMLVRWAGIGCASMGGHMSRLLEKEIDDGRW